jgi:hypothetical protein
LDGHNPFQSFFFLCILACTSLSCSYFKNDSKDETILASVYDQTLTLDDARDLISKNTSSADSISKLKNYADEWVRMQLLKKKAEDNITDNEALENIEKQLESYKNSLIAYAYQRELIRQKLDTVVSENEIQRYYNDHPKDFMLKDNIIKVLYLKLARGVQNLWKVKKWCKSESPEDRMQLEKFCQQNAENYYLDDNAWLFFDDLLKEIPIKTYDKEQFLKNNRFIEIQDSSGTYLVNIKGFRIRDGISPVNFEKENIRKIILNKRKVALIQEMEKKVYQDALKANDFKIYVK